MPIDPGHRGFITGVKTMLVQAIQATFDADFHIQQFRNLHCSIEYPNQSQDYPGVWVDFNTTGRVEIAGIDHLEAEEVESGELHAFRRWRFEGNAIFTAVALTSLERDLLVDEIVMVYAAWDAAFARPFRSKIEANPFVATNFNFDQITVTGMAASPGTPWGTDDILYEGTVSVETIGEIVIDVTDGSLITLTDIEVTEYPEGTPDPLPDDGEGEPWI